MADSKSNIPVLDLAWARDPAKKAQLLNELRSALFDVGFLHIINHGVEQSTIDQLTDLLPILFALPDDQKAGLSKINSPHFLGYSGFAEETTLGKQDLREQFDFATELPVVYNARTDSPICNDGDQYLANGMVYHRDFSKLYWRLRGPNQWPSKSAVPEFREALTKYHDAVQDLSFQFVNLIEEAFDIPVGTFDHFFGLSSPSKTLPNDVPKRSFLPPQHRIKLCRYPPSDPDHDDGQAVGAHKDSSGWLTFLYQVRNEPGLEVLSSSGAWLPVKPIDGSFVVNFGNAFDAATEGAVKATIHRVIAPKADSNVRYSVPFFQGLPLDMSVTEVRKYIPDKVRRMRTGDERANDTTSSFLDTRWDSLGESQLRKWIRSHKDVALKHYGQQTVDWYVAAD